ncbi:HIT family protein [Prosthecomicrobium sp. N25]|uniref:HIT family protein n=1 Tax=Prosthecomicrobium sp. N25 TaxID=3129254 RepID=UPI00307731B2
MTDFVLDPRLAGDSVPILEMPLSTARLFDNAHYCWVMLIPRQAGLVEITDLSRHDQGWLLDEINRVSAAVKQVSGCLKLNVAAIGNIVRQLHVHVVGRDEGDPAWPGPVWGGPRMRYEPAALAARAEALRAALARGAA